MNNNEYILNQELINRRILLKMYNKQAFKIKKQLYYAYLEKRSTHYLESLLASIEKEISTLDKFFQEYAKRQTKDSYLKGTKQADYQIKQLSVKEGLSVAGYSFGMANKEAVQQLAKETYIPLNKLTKTMARDCREYLRRENFESTESMLKQLNKLVDSETLRKMGIEGVADVVVGNQTWQQGMRNIKEEFLRQSDFKVPYYKKDGSLSRLVPIQEYAKMVARTTTAKIMREGTKDRILDTFGDDGDLVEIIGVSEFPNSPCIPYQGKILSISGNTPQDVIDKLGDDYMGLLDDAEAAGLFHPNCVHSMGVTDKIMAVYGYTPDETPKDEPEGEETPKQKDEVKPQEPEQEQEQRFKPADNIKDAKAYADTLVAGGGVSTFDKFITLDNLNEFNAHLTDLKNTYRSVNLTTIGSFTKRGNSTVLAHANHKLLEIEKKYGMSTLAERETMYKNGVINYNADLAKNIDRAKKLLESDTIDTYNYKRISKYLRKLEEENKYSRFTYQESAATHFRDTVTHEYGHSLMISSIFKDIEAGGTYEAWNGAKRSLITYYETNTYKKVKEAYYKAKTTGDIYKISNYAAKDADEFFAECFTIYHAGVEKLPDYIYNVIKEVVTK